MPPKAQPEEPEQYVREPLTPAKQKRLQQCFEHASKQMAQESYDYATELFSQCVLGDPSNLGYVQSYLGNLKKKYNNNKTGSKLAVLKERGARSAIKKALAKVKWLTVSFYKGLSHFKDPANWQRVETVLLTAGLPN